MEWNVVGAFVMGAAVGSVLTWAKHRVRRNLAMPPTSLFFDPSDPLLREKLEALQPTRGYCVFSDIVGSTSLKDRGLMKWAPAIYNTFSNVRSLLPTGVVPLKGLGDALMFFVPESLLPSAEFGALRLFAALVTAVRDPDSVYQELKVAVCYCADAYELSFLQNVPDVYGKDIDLTARLLSRAGAREVVMNEPFVLRLRDDFARAGNQEQYPEVSEVVGPWPEQLKGFAAPVQLYKLPAR